MVALSPVKLPMLDKEGRPITAALESWKISADLRNGWVAVRCPSGGSTLSLASLLAAEISNEREVRSVGKTIGRMALTGAGAALFSRGRDGGIGASLLDLSFRGAEKQGLVSGLLIWPNLCILKFIAKGAEIDLLSALIPQHAFEESNLQQVGELLNLIGRMKEDGKRATVELAVDIISGSRQLAIMSAEAEKGSSFEERDSARRSARALNEELQRKRSICVALMVEQGVSSSALLSETSIDDASQTDLLGNTAQGIVVTPSDAAGRIGSAQTEARRPPYVGIGIAVFGVIAIVALQLARQPNDRETTEQPNRASTLQEQETREETRSSPSDFATWNSQVRAAIVERKPSGVSGSAAVSFTVSSDGQIASVSASGDSEMRRAAIASIRGTTVPPPPDRRSHSFTIRIHD